MEENQMEVPEGWGSFKLGNILETIRNGYSGSQVNFITEFPVTRIETISDWRIDLEKVGYVVKLSESYKLTRGDILFSNINSIKHIGKIAYLEQDISLYHGMNLLLLRFCEWIDTKFISYYLLTRKNWFEKVATQAINQASINQSTLKELDLVIPKSLTEQRQIATILSKVDEAISQTGTLIAKYSRIKTGLMQDLLTKGIDEHGNIRSEETHQFKDSPLGRIPVEWDCLTIGNIAERLRSGITPKGGSEVYLKEGIMLIRSQNVYSYGFKLDDVAYISEEIRNQMLGSELKSYDVLLNITGASIGRSTFVPDNFPKSNVNQHVCSIRLFSPTLAKAIFLSTFLNSVYGQNQIHQNNAGSNREGINYNQIKAIYVPWFKNETEFGLFSKAISKISVGVERLSANLSKLQSIKQGLMQDLLNGKVRVNHLIKEMASA